jgi:hypothetical protein
VNGRNPRETEKELLQRLAAARKEYLRLDRAADEIFGEAPSGMPLSDGQLRVVNARRQLHLAFEKYQEAMKCYSAFVRGGPRR